MGEARREALRIGCDRSIKLEFHGAKVSVNAKRVMARLLPGHRMATYDLNRVSAGYKCAVNRRSHPLWPAPQYRRV